ncbi:MAG: hypothetical protein HYU39_10905 [Thaumarchaeota archaeon]|nr:hypothetical protein [Nitrososphaerota archaeon]
MHNNTPDNKNKQQETQTDKETTNYISEACYYLKEIGLNYTQIATKMQLPETQIRKLHKTYSNKIKKGQATKSQEDQKFWENFYHDTEGNVKITFAGKNGFHHCRKTDLENMDNKTLMTIFEDCKQFLETDIHKAFLNHKPPAGFDPMILTREIKKAAQITEEILNQRWKKEKQEPTP